MSLPKVSVIVPVYNVEKYLEKCLDSLVHQTLDAYEVIVVNDGSPDNSQEIIDKYAEKYPEIICAYKKENGGLGDARNFGLERARGEYVGFVDSDDWVDAKMFSAMYDFAKTENNDVVICDFIEINDGWKQGHVSKGYRGDESQYPIDKYMFIMNSINPATACNKIYRRELFMVQNFPAQWYEDIATTPILLSYANKIGYLPLALYYYRQTATSITKISVDKRNLDVIKAWENCLNNCKSEWLEPMQCAVYKSICTFINFKPQYAQDYLNYAKRKEKSFKENTVISDWLKKEQVENLFEKELIPKIIHYFWFGGNPKSELIQKCIESWKRNAPDFEIIEWNETNCNMHVNRYVEEAYAAKKWAFVADYFRMEKIAEYGGIYFDTDVELMQNPSGLLLNPAFFAFETRDTVNACIFGALPHHKTIEFCQKSYKNTPFITENGTYNTSFTIVRRITQQLEKYGITFNGEEQVLKNKIRIYPANKLAIDVFDGENIAQHHYDCSWWDVKVGVVSYKNTVLADYFTTTCAQSGNLADVDVMNQLAYYKSECNRYENSTCWKITAPLRMLGDFLKRVLGKRK